MTPIRYSIGINKFDARPQEGIAADFREFTRRCLDERGRSSEKHKRYVAAPFSDGHRCKGSVLPRRWLPLDLDGGVDREAFVRLCRAASEFSSFLYSTSSHRPDAPRARIVFELDGEASRDESMSIGPLVEKHLCTAAKWDPSVHRGEQPIYLPLLGADSRICYGTPLKVDYWLDLASPPPAPPPPRFPSETWSGDSLPDDELAKFLAEFDLVRFDRGDRLIVRCPWRHEHTDPDLVDAASTYFRPGASNGGAGGYVCLHSHCQHRTVGDLWRLFFAHKRLQRCATR